MTAAELRDPLAELKRLSWPITATVHVRPNGSRLLLIGDQHNSLRGTCSKGKPGTRTVTQLLDELIDFSARAGTDLDVFTEMQLQLKTDPEGHEEHGDALLRQMEARYESGLGGWASRGRQKILEWMRLDTLFGRHPGFLLELMYEFRYAFLKPDPKLVARGVRFHYADARVNSILAILGADLRTVLFGSDGSAPMLYDSSKGDATRLLYQTYPSVAAVRQVMRALCFSTRLVQDVADAGLSGEVGAKAAGNLASHPLITFRGRGESSSSFYKVAKQVAKLGANDARTVRRFYDGVLAPPITAAEEQAYASLRQQILSGEQGGDLPNARALAVHVLLRETLALMDCYLVARMVLYMRQQRPGSTTVVYAGDLHVENYRNYFASYFVEHDRMEHSVCSRRDGHVTRADLFSVDRCIDMRGCVEKAALHIPDRPMQQPAAAYVRPTYGAVLASDKKSKKEPRKRNQKPGKRGAKKKALSSSKSK